MLKTRQIHSRHGLLVSALLLCLAAVAGSTYAQSAGISGFTPIGDYLVEIDEQDQDSAQIFGARGARSLIIMSSELPAPLLVNLADGSVAGLQLMKVAQRDNGSLDLLPDPIARQYGQYRIDGARIVFEVEGREVVIKPKPVLVGNRSAAEIVAYDPDYGVKRDAYVASPELIEKLRRQDAVRVRVYFGSWCPFCGEMVPRVLKVEQALEGSAIQFEYYGLPHQISDDSEARAMSISGVPTGIVYRGGKEIGRINGSSWQSPEQAILDILQG